MEIVVDENRFPREIEVLSPLGFRLDEKAVEAVFSWRFTPAEKEGRPVAVRARVEVSFRLTGLGFDDKTEQIGSRDAQFMLGGIYEKGTAVDPDQERSKRYYRLCAASAMPEWEFRLGRLLIDSPQRKEADPLQGIAWL